MLLLDENIIEYQRMLLHKWGLRAHQIGYDFGRKGLEDDQIIPMLHKIGKVTFFTRDLGFYRKELCHPRYCIVCLSINQDDVAKYIRLFLQHSKFNTQAKRIAKIVRISHLQMRLWEMKNDSEQKINLI